jgi:PKD repeat protein
MKNKLIILFVCLGYLSYSSNYVLDKELLARSKSRIDISAFKQKSSGNLIVTGVYNGNLRAQSLKIDSSFKDDIFLMELDPDLNLIISKPFYFKGNELVNDIAILPTGDFVVTGYFDNSAFDFKEKHASFLLKLNSEFKIIQKKIFSEETDTYIEKMHVDSLGNIFCIGTNKKEIEYEGVKIDSSLEASKFLLKLNKNFEPIYAQQIKSKEELELIYSNISEEGNLTTSFAFKKNVKYQDKQIKSDSLYNSIVLSGDIYNNNEIEYQVVKGDRVILFTNGAKITNNYIDNKQSDIVFNGKAFFQKKYSQLIKHNKDKYLFLESNTKYSGRSDKYLYKQTVFGLIKENLTHKQVGFTYSKPRCVINQKGVYIIESYLERGVSKFKISKHFNCENSVKPDLERIYETCEGIPIKLNLDNAWFVDEDKIYSRSVSFNKAGLKKIVIEDEKGCRHNNFLITRVHKNPRLLDSMIVDANNSIVHDGSINLITDKDNYQFDWNSGDKKSAITNLKSGEYTVKITDTATGCFVNKEFEIKDKESGVDYFRADFTRYQISNNKYQIHFKNTSYGDKLHYAWLIDGELKSRDKDFEYEFSSGTFEVCLLVSKSKIQLSMLAELSSSLSTKTQKLAFDTELFEADFDFRYLSDTKLGFRNLSTENLENPIWKFSDGSDYNQFELEKTFENSGIYEVELEVENIFGEKFSKKDQIIIGELTAQQVEQFKIIEDLKSKINKDNIDLLSYPNPMKTYSCMVYNLISDSKVKIELYNIIGTKRILLQKEQMQQKGNHKLIYENQHNLQQGIYQLVLTVDGVRYNFGLEVE